MMMTRRAALGAAALIGAPAVLRAAPGKALVKLGGLSVLSDVGLFMAQANRYFDDEGITIETVNFTAGPQIVPPLSTNQIQVSGLSTSPALFNAMTRGLGVRLVADKGRVSKGFGGAAIVVRADLADRVKSFSDLKGLKISVPAKGVSTYTQLLKALELGGLKPDDVDTLSIGFPDMISALSNKAVDAAMLVEPFVAIAVERKVGVRWKGVEDFMPFPAQNGVIAYSEQFMKDQPDVAERWMTAYLRGVRTYLDLQSDPGKRDDVFAVVSQFTELKNRALFDEMQPIGFDRDGRVELQSIQFDEDWFQRLGFQPTEIAAQDTVEPRFAAFAAKELDRRDLK